MARVAFTTHLQRFAASPPDDVSGSTVREVLDSVFRDNPQLRGYVVDESGALRRHVSVFVDSAPIQDRIGLSDAVAPNGEVYVIQALSGGQGG